MTKASLAAVSFLAAVVACSNGCGATPTTPSLDPPAAQPGSPNPPAPSPPWAGPPPATIRSLKLSGNLALTRVGETSQLTVMGTFTDDTTKDVTADCRWTQPLPTVASLSQAGLLTATGFGAWRIGCQLPSALVRETLTSTPTGTFAIGGRLTEPEHSDRYYFDPIPNALIVDIASGRSATTDSSGSFAMGDLRGPPLRVAITKEGFERAEADVRQELNELALQRVIRLTPGETVSPPPLAGYDVTYTIDGKLCFPCRLIRVNVPEAGTIGVRVTWTVPDSTITLFVEGQVLTGSNEIITEVRINEPREVVMYVGGASPKAVPHTPFTFATSVR